MVHGYHVIFCAYGFWLPNDPRGSWSDFVGAWELRRFGPATKSIERKTELTTSERARLAAAKQALQREPVTLSGEQALQIGYGFAEAVHSSGLEVWACSILPEHVHLVLSRHRLSAEIMVRLLKGAASKHLRQAKLHPFAAQPKPDGTLPSPWSVGKWIAFLDSETAIDNAIHYVEQNPIKEAKPAQTWSFVTPFRGLDKAWITYH